MKLFKSIFAVILVSQSCFAGNEVSDYFSNESALYKTKNDNWKTDIKLWDKNAENQAKTQASRGASPEWGERDELKKNIGVALNTLADNADMLPEEVGDKVKNFAKGYTLYMNGDLMAWGTQNIARTVLSEENMKYFNLCYKEDILNSGPSVDVCSLLALPDIDPCEPLPTIPGYSKQNLSPSVARKAITETVKGTDFAFDAEKWIGPNALVDYCKQQLKAESSDTPLEPKSIKEHIVNKDPVATGGVYSAIQDNINAKELANSGVLNPSAIAELTISKKGEDGKIINVKPLAGLTNTSNPKAALAKGYIDAMAYEIVLGGGSEEDVKYAIKMMMNNPKSVNVTFENDFQFMVGVKLIKNDRLKEMSLVEDYNDLLNKMEMFMVNDPLPDEMGGMFSKIVNEYKKRVGRWSQARMGYYLLNERMNDSVYTKDYIDSAVKGSQEELLDRMAMVHNVNKITNKEGFEMAKIELEGLKKIQRFVIDLEKVVVVSKPFDVNSARIAAGLEPYGDSEDPISAVTSAVSRIISEEVSKYTENLIKTGG